MKIPILGDYFDRTVPPEDNVSRCSIPQTAAGNLMIWRSPQFHQSSDMIDIQVYDFSELTFLQPFQSPIYRGYEFLGEGVLNDMIY